MNSYRAIKIISFVVILILILMQKGQAQSPTEDNIQLQKADFRGQRPQGAFIAASSASRQDVVVVIVEGGGEELIAETEGNLRVLVRNGYTRLGLILCDLLPETQAPTVVVVSGGLTYAVVHDAKADAKTSADLFQLIRDVYIEDILPKLKPAAESVNGGGL